MTCKMDVNDSHIYVCVPESFLPGRVPYLQFHRSAANSHNFASKLDTNRVT